MQLTQFTDYSLRTLMYLSYRDRSSPVTISEIAEQFQLPRNHLVKVVNKLGKLGWIDATRGRNGGLRLAVLPEHLTLGQILQGVEQSTELIDCEKSYCRLRGGCKLKDILDQGLKRFYQHMSEYTLADLVDKPTGTKIEDMHRIWTSTE
ncbi:MAG: BadM/Rrf2 family transcriptional regulator [Alteromonadaceae bacterium]|nr:MAG: BadM/Rrf2 family transcriptional regulator [Alteromonadaceae bacterium]